MQYGRKSGDGPNTGKKAVIYLATTPTGTEVRRRVFNDIPVDAGGQPLAVCVAALLPPHNGHDWSLWVVASLKQTMPDYVGKGPGPNVVFVEARLSR